MCVHMYVCVCVCVCMCVWRVEGVSIVSIKSVVSLRSCGGGGAVCVCGVANTPVGLRHVRKVQDNVPRPPHP